MNRRELITAAIAAAVVPGELAIEPAAIEPLPVPSVEDFTAYTQALIRQIAAAMQVPYEEAGGWYFDGADLQTHGAR